MPQVSHDSETPAHGQQVITACALIHQVFDGVEKIFLPKRAAAKKFLPGIFELPGGHINFGEDIVSGLTREIREEFGMDISVGDPFYVFTYTNEVKGSHSIEVDYFATFSTPISEIKLNPEDHSEYFWFAEAEIGPKVAALERSATNPEIQAIYRGFALLKSQNLNFG